MITKIYVSNPDIGYFLVNSKDRIIGTGDSNKLDWDRSFIEMHKSRMNNEVYVSFNKIDNEAIGKRPIYRPILGCNINKIENIYDK